jgi:DNA-binding transcriptional MerR regulator
MASAAHSAMEIPEKDLFRIGEVSRLTATKSFVLRYWESEFPMLQPVKSPSGHRLYRREDIETVLKIKRLLYEEGFTIAGARKHLSELPEHSGNGASQPRKAVEESSAAPTTPVKSPTPNVSEPSPEQLQALHDLREELRAILTLLEGG